VDLIISEARFLGEMTLNIVGVLLDRLPQAGVIHGEDWLLQASF
jgi:hypothetical protein